MSDILFDTATLQGVIAALPTPKVGLLARHFPTIVESEQREIYFDVDGTDLRMTPFCSPLVEAPIVEPAGFSTKSFRPAYAKEKTPFTTRGHNTRAMGEKIGGEMSPAQRLEKAIALDMAQKLKRLNLRFEWLATRAMLDGKVTVAGKGYPSTVVDFGRSAALTKTLTSGNRWGDSGVSPLDQLHTWASETETPVSDWYMSADAYGKLIADAAAKDRLKTDVRGTNTVSFDAMQSMDMTLMGQLDGWRIWVAPKVQVTQEDGTAELIFPDKTVLGVSATSFTGVQHFGAIEDVEAASAGLSQGQYYVKSWVNPDPSVRFVLLQSAPLMVPYRPDSTLRANVM